MTPPTAIPIAPEPPLMTAAEFVALHGGDSGVELVKGRVVRGPMPGAIHGEVCGKASYYLTHHVMQARSGRTLGNDTFIRTGTNPDAYRGADVCFISYTRLPKDQPLPRGPLEIAPELVIEVRSPTDRMGAVLGKIAEYLNAGVQVVVLLDPSVEFAAVYREADDFPQRFSNGDNLTLPDVLPGFTVPVRSFFG